MLQFHTTKTHRALRGSVLNPISDTRCDLYQDGIIAASEQDGSWKIEAIGPASEIAARYGWQLEALPKNEGVLLPPFYDLHFHWVQDDVREMPKTSLLEWLERYTFPAEAKFAEAAYAEEKAAFFWKRILSVGTVGGLCYSSIHPTALAAAMRHAPDGFRIGNVLMTMNCPDFLQQSHAEAIASAQDAATAYGDRYCVTPRFAPTTHPEVLEAGAAIASKHDLYQQTHLCETPAEIDWVVGMYREMEGYEDVESYTEIYQRCGVLGPKTVMGHVIHMTESEWRMLAESDTAIASCPTSNAPVEQLGLGSGLFDWQEAQRHGVRWSLASDIGGGPFLSMFDVMESFVQQNKTAGTDEASYVQALFRSTQAGADLLGLGANKGNLSAGKAFDCIQCSITENSSSNAEELIASIIESAQSREQFDALVSATLLDGEIVYQRQD